LEKSTSNVLSLKLKTSGGIRKDANGIYQTYEISGIESRSVFVLLYYTSKASKLGRPRSAAER
jgi:hypothetical protein